MNPMLKTIHDKGYWEFVLRPVPRIENRISKTKLPEVLQELKVSLRGWDFPMVEGTHSEKQFGQGYFESQIAWEYYLEYCALTTSGQFFHSSGFEDDWQERVEVLPRSSYPVPPMKHVFVDLLALQLGEVFVFASRLTNFLGADAMSIEATLGGVAGRTLEFRMPGRHLWTNYSTKAPEIRESAVHTRDELGADPRGMASLLGARLAEHFGANLSPDIFRDIQDKTFRHR